MVLGAGDPGLSEAYAALAKDRPKEVSFQPGFHESLAHRIYAAADLFLMPSRFEPCGLNQMYSLRYGTPPVVRATGGLADTVTDGVNGFVFKEATAEALLLALQRAVATWHDRKAWEAMQTDGMGRDVSWTKPAAQYAALYARIMQ